MDIIRTFVKAKREELKFPFFDGLIPEGWLLDTGERHWKLNSRDRFELLINLQIPPKVEYTLTPLGESLVSPLMHLYDWGSVHMPEIEASRERYENASAI